jgi:quinohemoprotein ethanol dehydrogenase
MAGGYAGDLARAAPDTRATVPAATQYLDSSSGEDWPGFGRTFGEQHFSPLTQIGARDVSRLGLAWYFDLGPGNPVTQPVEVGGTLYFSSGMSIVHAVDARTGKLLWQFDTHVGDHAGPEMRFSWGSRGIASWNGKIYAATVDGRLIAIDATKGTELWTVQTTTKGSGQYITGAPRAFDGKVIIGQGGGDYTRTRGYASAYDAETGKFLWRFYVVPGDPAKGFENKAMEMAAKTWHGEWWKWGGGGEPWNAFTYDAETRTLLIGTGNGYPWNQKIRSPGGGDNLFLCSVVAVDADTGEYKWHYQINPGESWDFNATMDMELADLTIGGKPRKVVLTAPKNGFFYVIDRTNGKLISAQRIVAKMTWATGIDPVSGRPVEVPGARYPDGKDFDMWPGARGAHSWLPMAYSPNTRLVYIPKIEHGLNYSDRGIDATHFRQFGVDLGAVRPDPLDNTSTLLAWNPATQKAAWKVDTIGGWGAGVLATAGNLVFQGQLNGRFSAYAADSGRELWHFPAEAAILAAPITYSAGGKQYVTVLVGMGVSPSTEPNSHGGIVIDGRTQAKRVLTFDLDGKVQLPPPPPPVVVKAPADPDYKPDSALAARGNRLFIDHCIVCHGIAAVGGGGAPDLRTSGVPLSLDAFTSVLHDGPLVSNGMPKFAELSGQDVAALRQYIRSRSDDLRGEKP